MIGWVILIILGITALATLFVVLTDGRYVGKRLTRWIYDRFGPAIFGAHSEAQRWRALAETLQLCGGETILDVGTAIGDLPLTIATMPAFHGRALGVDWSPRMMAVAQGEARRLGLNSRVQFCVADVREPFPFGSGGFDVVFCLGLLETLPHPESVLGELKRVLTPDGVLVLSLYRGWAASNTALGLDWYQGHLSALEAWDLQVVPCRRNQEVVIAHLRKTGWRTRKTYERQNGR